MTRSRVRTRRTSIVFVIFFSLKLLYEYMNIMLALSFLNLNFYLKKNKN